jgi:molecular chaperone HtpG
MGMMGDLPETFTIVINGNHPLISELLKKEGDAQIKLGKHVYDLARLSQGILKGKELTSFINRSLEVVN